MVLDVSDNGNRVSPLFRDFFRGRLTMGGKELEVDGEPVSSPVTLSSSFEETQTRTTCPGFNSSTAIDFRLKEILVRSTPEAVIKLSLLLSSSSVSQTLTSTNFGLSVPL